MNTSVPQLSIQTFLNPFNLYSDSRKHGYSGSSRNVRLARATPPGGGAIAKSEDGIRCAVTGKESLRILRISEPSQAQNQEHKSAVGRGGHRIDASRNFWEGSGLKIDSASTDVAWGHGLFNNKILTSGRNGDLIMWDLNKSGVTKYERRTKDHIRSIHKMSVSHIVHHYCITGSADGHMRVWDLRDLSKSIMRVHHPMSVRSLVFSPSFWQPLQAVVGLDNGSIYRWDLKMGQRGQLDKLPVAHSASVTTLDWCPAGGVSTQSSTAIGVASQADTGGLGWLVSGGLDRCVKVWDLTAPGAGTHIPHKPTYTLHPSFAVRRVAWRPGYECEIALVSSTEFATSSADLSQPSPGPVASGLLTRVGSGMGLDSIFRPGGTESVFNVKDKLNIPTISEAKTPSSAFGSGDAVEIWDVRRGYIAKWSVTGSAVEGGVTDIAFGDSHAIWAEHASGSFSQIDLRDATKPVDAITRVAATWEASGSMAFVADHKPRWEIPYDDVRPEQQQQRISTEVKKSSSKALGDVPAKITSQTMATYAHDFAANDLETFMALARGYIFEGRDRKEICAYNSGVAFSAGQDSAAQFWLLLGTCLSQYIPSYPPTPPLSPPLKSKKVPSPLIPENLSPKPPSVTAGYSFPPSLHKTSGSPSSLDHKMSPGRRSTSNSDLSRIVSASTSTSRRLTPTSSTSSSPRLLPIGLPPSTPRRPSFFGRRESVDSGVSRHSSMLRRPSLSVTPGQSLSPSDRGTPSLRHVGEGVLDDSDSSGSDEDEEGDQTPGVNSSDEESGLRPLISPGLTAPRAFPTPSPLSRVVGQQTWTEDEADGEDGINDDDDDASSPSPQSTDTESDGSTSPNKRPMQAKLLRRNSGRVKSRSRSSTVASLAAPTSRPLIHQDSRSSIRTVTAGEAPFRDQEESNLFEPESSPRHPQRDFRPGHGRQKSQALSELVFNGPKAIPSPDEVYHHDDPPDENLLSERRIEIIRLEEMRFRKTTLGALQEALEDFADEGDVQMCAMLALVAPEELHISRGRVTRFLDSYIELLTRLRLYTCASYVRKYCQTEEIRKATLLETTIYTSCGKCRKPLLLPAGSFNPKEINRGAFSYCLACKASCVACSICRLPVRALLFQCSVCNHGGHQACYRQYYMQQPMVDLPTSLLPPLLDIRCRASMRNSTSVLEDDSSSTISMQSTTVDASVTDSPVQSLRLTKLAGHPCAAGCGHFCWAANRDSQDI
ncbi:hypothetical protein B0H34DRAFT_156740 [Crassisporium funariophilum]|nr:hypothetical protein B0H34DRAFT_156740 [Crassisporium funariophilum]